MTTSGWSHPSLSPQTNSSDQAESPSSPQRNLMFRSYRHLPNSVPSYNSRISLNSNLPRAVNGSFRSNYLSSDMPAFWLQRSASVRNIPLAHSGSVNNLGGTAAIAEDDRFLGPSHLMEHRPGSNEEFHSANIDQHNVSNPCHMVDDLLSRQMRNNSHRFSQSVEGPFGIGATEAEISLANRPTLARNVSANYSSSEEPLDRSLVFTNPSMNITNNAALSLRNLTLESASRNATVSGRSHSRNPASTPNRALRRRVTRETTDNTSSNQQRPNTSHVRVRDQSLLSGGPEERRLSVPVRAAYRSRINSHHSTDRPRSQFVNPDASRMNPADREIHVRHVSHNMIPQGSNFINEAPSTTSISGASSIEDLRPAAMMTPDLRRVNPRARGPEPATETKESPKSSDDSPSPHGIDDWRADAEGSKDLWRRILLNERFADVWFTVGGTQILTSANSSCIVSPDPGAPGGPTSAANYTQSSIRSTIQSLAGPDGIHQFSDREQSTNNATTPSQHTKSDADLTANEGTDVGSDLDDSSPSIKEEPVKPISPPIPIPKETETDSRLKASSALDGQELPEDVSGQVASTSYNPGKQTKGRGDSTANNSCSSKFGNGTTQSTPAIHRGSGGARSQLVREGSAQPLSMSCEINRSNCWRFGAHRLVLAAASPVFEAMFYGPVAELNSRNAQTTTEYHIPDIHPRAFQSMLLYIYSDEIELDDDLDIVFYVLYAAKKYMLPRLGRHCVEHLKELLTASNVCAMLDRSLFFDEEDLTRRCWHVIDVLASNVLTSPGLLKMDANNLKALLKRDTLNCKESEVFAAVRRWAAAECTRLGLRDVIYNRAQVAADLLHLVRFPTMNLSDFAENVAYSGFLSLEMVRDLFVHITTNNSTQPSKNARIAQTSLKQNNAQHMGGSQSHEKRVEKNGAIHNEPTSFSGPFSSEPRRGPRLWRCSRFTRTGKHLFTSSPNNTHQHSIVFQVSNSVFLAGIGLYGSTQIGEQFTVHVELSHYQPRIPLTTGVASVGTQFHGPGDSNETRSPSDRPAPCLSAPVQRNPTRSSSLLEFARFDWSGRPQPTRRPPNHGSQEDTVIVIPSDLSRVNGTARTENRTSAKDSDSLAVIRTQLESDGSSRIYEVFFPCPVKIIRDQRYVIHVHTNHGERLVSASSSSTAMNSSSLYIGLFGRPEVRVPCLGDDLTRDAHIGRAECMRKSRHHGHGKASNYANPPVDGREVAFYFSENTDGLDHGEVDRGFLPELLFYTCS